MMKHIIVVEDNAMVGTVYKTTLQRLGYRVTVHTDGEAGLAAIEASRPDLVLLDLMLPTIGGLEILRRLRASADCAELPVIITSNSYTSSRLDELWQAGATQVVNKASMTPNELARLVRDSLGRTDAPRV